MEKIGYIIEGSGQDHTLPFNSFYVMQSICGEHTKLGWSANLERRRAELSVQYRPMEMVVVYDGTPANGKAPKTLAKKIERMGLNFLTRLGFNGYLTDANGEDGFEWFENVPNEILAECICHAEHAASKEIEYQEFGKNAPRKATVKVITNGIKRVQQAAQATDRLYYGVAQHGDNLFTARKKYNGQPKDWNGDLGKRVAIKSQRIHVRFSAQHPVTVCKRKRASVETALSKI